MNNLIDERDELLEECESDEYMEIDDNFFNEIESAQLERHQNEILIYKLYFALSMK